MLHEDVHGHVLLRRCMFDDSLLCKQALYPKIEQLKCDLNSANGNYLHNKHARVQELSPFTLFIIFVIAECSVTCLLQNDEPPSNDVIGLKRPPCT